MRIILLLLISQYSFATNYYFSTVDGNDSRTSTQAQSSATPWQSVTKLNSFFASLSSGDSVLFKRGETFFGQIVVAKSGVVISAYGSGAAPIITGFYTLTGWASMGGNMYQSSCASCKPTLNNVVIDDMQQSIGRYPNSGWLYFEDHTANTQIVDYTLSGSPNFTGGEVVIRKNHFIIDRNTISSHVGTTITYAPGSSYNGINGFGYFIQNDSLALDSLGEWWFRNSTKHVKAYFGAINPASVTVKASVIDTLVYVNGYNDVTFSNLTFQGSNVTSFMISGSNRISILNCSIDKSGGNAISATNAPNIAIRSNTINHTNNNGIQLDYACVNAVLSQNIVSNTALFPGMGRNSDGTYTAISTSGDNGLVEFNSVSNSGYNGIYFIGDSTTVKNNFVTSSCMLKDDGGGIYTYLNLGDPPEFGKKIIGNIVTNSVGITTGTDNPFFTQANGIYLDGSTFNVEVTGNTSANNTDFGIYLNGSQNINIRSNNLYGNGRAQLIMYNTATNISGLQIKKNTFFSTKASQNAIQYFSTLNNLPSLGTTDSNYFSRPFDDQLQFLVLDSPHAFPGKKYNLEGWQSYGFDTHSSNSPKVTAGYTYTTTGSNLFADSALTGIAQMGYNGYTTISTVTTGGIDGNTLKVVHSNALDNDFAVVQFYLASALTAGKTYVVGYSLRGTKPSSCMLAYLIQYNSPFSQISDYVPVPLTPARTENEFLIPVTATNTQTWLRFLFRRADSAFFVDNFTVYELASLTYKNPNDYFKFSYNASQANTSVAFPGYTYKDAAGSSFLNRITLAPYASSILFSPSLFAIKPGSLVIRGRKIIFK